MPAQKAPFTACYIWQTCLYDMDKRMLGPESSTASSSPRPRGAAECRRPEAGISLIDSIWYRNSLAPDEYPQKGVHDRPAFKYNVAAEDKLNAALPIGKLRACCRNLDCPYYIPSVRLAPGIWKAIPSNHRVQFTAEFISTGFMASSPLHLRDIAEARPAYSIRK